MFRTVKTIKNIAAGVLIGLINGFFGSAGGIMAVEALERGGMEEKQAHATALFIIFPLSVFSAYLYASAGYFLWDAVLYTGIGAFIGGIIGAVALQKVKAVFINSLFNAIIFVTGIWMLI